MNEFFYIEDEKGRRHRYTSPRSWNQLSEKNLLIWAGICLQKLSLDFALRTALMLICAIPERFFFRLSDEGLAVITPRLDFLFGKNKLNVWVIKTFKHCGTVFYGPADYLGNLKIKEFRRTELYYQKYQATKDSNFLRLLVATLYRPIRSGVVDDDPREDLNEKAVFDHADLFKGKRFWRFRFLFVKPHFLHAVLLNYEGCRALIHESFPTVFVKGPAGNSGKVYDLEDLIDTIAGGAMGDALTTENINVYRFLKHLAKQIDSAEKIKRK